MISCGFGAVLGFTPADTRVWCVALIRPSLADVLEQKNPYVVYAMYIIGNIQNVVYTNRVLDPCE